jgi:hypothetical protein
VNEDAVELGDDVTSSSRSLKGSGRDDFGDLFEGLNMYERLSASF